MAKTISKADFICTKLQHPKGPLEEDCPICFETQDTPTKLSCNCKLVYCQTCILTWLGKTNRCTCCRIKLFKKRKTNTEFLPTMLIPTHDIREIFESLQERLDAQYGELFGRLQYFPIPKGSNLLLDTDLLGYCIWQTGNRWMNHYQHKHGMTPEEEMQILNMLVGVSRAIEPLKDRVVPASMFWELLTTRVAAELMMAGDQFGAELAKEARLRRRRDEKAFEVLMSTLKRVQSLAWVMHPNEGEEDANVAHYAPSGRSLDDGCL